MRTKFTSLCNILMPRFSVCSEQELYFRTDKEGLVEYHENKKAIEFKSSGVVTFDTYFNSFSIEKYIKYCKCSEFYLKLNFCGSFVLRIFSVKKENDRFEEKCIFEEIISSENAEYITVEFGKDVPENTAQVYFTLTAQSKSIFYGGEFGCCSKSKNSVSIAVVICTYKREEYLLKNLDSINEYFRTNGFFSKDMIHCYVIDNGKTLSADMVENSFVSLFQNANTGGSGGFKRGYIEAVHSGRNHTHILFMDDDIVLDCEMFFRVYMLLALTKSEWSELSVGGTMLKFQNPGIQHEAGAIWDGKRIINIGKGMNMTKRENVFEISYYPRPNYNAWWFYCFPICWYKEHGYPLQFFIKVDDIEYSLRCATEIAIINGIAVWHEDFENKYGGFVEYYIKRNELIMTSVRDQKPYTLFQVRKLIFSVARHIVYQRYFIADIILKAYDDYLKGYKYFLGLNTEKFNLELISLCEKLISDSELKEKYGVYFDEEKYQKSLEEYNNIKKQALTLNGYLIPSCFYKRDKDNFAIADIAKCKFVNFYKHKRVLHYDFQSKRGFVTVQKRTKLIKYGFLVIVKSIKFIFKYPKVRREFKQHLDEMTKE